jgi:hypothetical protein
VVAPRTVRPGTSPETVCHLLCPESGVTQPVADRGAWNGVTAGHSHHITVGSTSTSRLQASRLPLDTRSQPVFRRSGRISGSPPPGLSVPGTRQPVSGQTWRPPRADTEPSEQRARQFAGHVRPTVESGQETVTRNGHPAGHQKWLSGRPQATLPMRVIGRIYAPGRVCAVGPIAPACGT